MSASHDLIRRLRFIIDHDLSAVLRLNGDETWIGPTAETAATHFRQMSIRLQVSLEDLIGLDRASDDIMNL